jgi:glycosyltransferase involved in cell wall biosynthesis
MNVIFLCKRQYTRKDVINDKFGRLWHFPYELSIAGINVDCFSLSYRRRGYSQIKINDNQTWTSIDTGLLVVPALYQMIRKVIKVIRLKSPCIIISSSDVIHLAIASYLSKKCSVPLVIDLYDNYESFGFTKFPMMKRIYRNAIRQSDAVICVTRQLSERVGRYCGQGIKPLVITNATDKSLFRPMDKEACRSVLGLPSAGFFIGTAGALDESRDIRVLYKAYERLLSEGLDIHLVLAGKISSKNAMPDMKNVHYLGELAHTDVAQLYNSLDVAVIHLTDNEFGRYCFPQKAYEILACRRPVVASAVGVMQDLFSDYPECLYDDGNVEMLVKALCGQMTRPTFPEIPVPEWKDQREKLFEVLHRIDACIRNAGTS